MSEHSFPLDDLLNGASNGSAPVTEKPVVAESIAFTSLPTDDVLPLPRVDVERNVFITSRGNEIQFSDNIVSGLVVQQLTRQGKPEIPYVEVTLVGGRKQLEPHPQHEGYKAQLTEWQAKAESRSAIYMFNLGVKGQPPQAFVEEYSALFPNATQSEMKYLWVSSQLPNEDVSAFSEAIISRGTPTAKGIDEASNFST